MIKRIVKIFLFILLIFGIYKGIQIHHDVKQVMQYRSLVREVLAEEDTTANENLILAMIYTETKGREDDVMRVQVVRPILLVIIRPVFAKVFRLFQMS